MFKTLPSPNDHETGASPTHFNYLFPVAKKTSIMVKDEILEENEIPLHQKASNEQSEYNSEFPERSKSYITID